jgi:hypothetical protein
MNLGSRTINQFSVLAVRLQFRQFLLDSNFFDESPTIGLDEPW